MDTPTSILEPATSASDATRGPGGGRARAPHADDAGVRRAGGAVRRAGRRLDVLHAVDLLARRTYRTTDSYPVVGALDLQTGDANVTIVPDATDRIVVDRTVRRGLVRVVDHDMERDGTLVIDDGCHRIFSWTCSMSITIHMPVQLTIQGAWPTATSTTAGPLALLRLSTGDGDIDLDAGDRRRHLHTGDGDIAIHALTSPAVSMAPATATWPSSWPTSPQQIRIAQRRRGRRRLPAPRHASVRGDHPHRQRPASTTSSRPARRRITRWPSPPATATSTSTSVEPGRVGTGPARGTGAPRCRAVT